LLTTECDSGGRACRFVAKPNSSLNGKGKVIFFAAVLLLSLVIAIRFWLLGAWMVLPMVLLEMVVLATAFYLVDRASRDSETIDITENELQVTKRCKSDIREWHFQPYWVQVNLRKDRINWYPTHLDLRSHGKSIEIGTCLTDEEREELSEGLKRGLEILKPAKRI